MDLSTNPLVRSLLYALGIICYTAFVAAIMTSGSAIFGNTPSIFGAVAFLMLFVLSAAIVGLLVFGKPVMLYMAGERKEAIAFLTATICWLAMATFILIIFRLAGS